MKQKTEETSSVKILKAVHKKLKPFVATTEESMVAFLSRAAVNQMKADKTTARILKSK